MKNTTVLIIGKGPSLLGRVFCDNSSIIHAALNTAITLCEPAVDYHFINDFENLNKISKDDFNKSSNLILPTYPHINEGANINYSWKEFMKHLPEYTGTVGLYRLYTAPVIDENIEYLDVRWSVAETATLYFISRGIRNFKYIGVGKQVGYNSLLSEKVPSHQTSSWLTTNYDRLISHLTKANCKYDFLK